MIETNYSDELKQLIVDKTTHFRPVSKTTLTKYIQSYNYLSKSNGKENNWITETSVPNLIKLINNIDTKPTGKLNNLNIIILIKKNTMDNIKPLLDLRDNLNKELKGQYTELRTRKNDELPPYSEIENYIDNLYDTNQPTSFLINHLCFEYALRNKDLNLYLIPLEKYKLATNPLNYLVIRKTDCLLVISDYKTCKNYNTKRILVRSKKVLNFARKLGEGYLLVNRFNEPLADDNLSYYVNLYTTKNDVRLTESDYYKIKIKHLQTLPNSLEEISKLANTRGSSLHCANECYNLNKT
jgi:hypothetical protein